VRLTFCRIAFLALPPIMNCYGQEMSLDSLLRTNSYEMSIESGVPTGDGFEFIMDAVRDAQFLAIAEEHNVGALNDLTALLFKEMHQSEGFNYLALEQGSVIASWLGDEERRGDLEAISYLVGNYPNAPTFATDEELKMIASVGAISGAASNPIWGVDQELGAIHILDRLAELAPNSEAASKVKGLVTEARKYELDRFGETHYISQILKPEDLADLPVLFQAAGGNEVGQLISALQRSNRIYHNFNQARQGLATGYESAREREESMKLRFLEQYRMAQAAGDSVPRVLAKLGHWHIFRGIYKSNVTTFGNFLSEFSLSNGMKTFILSTYVIDSPESWRNTGGVIAEAARSTAFTVFDFRELRRYAHQNKIANLTDDWKRLLFQADAALIIRGGRTGSYTVVGGNGHE